MSWRTEGAKAARLEASITRVQSELEGSHLREHERRLLEAELTELRIELEQARAGRKLL